MYMYIASYWYLCRMWAIVQHFAATENLSEGDHDQWARIWTCTSGTRLSIGQAIYVYTRNPSMQKSWLRPWLHTSNNTLMFPFKIGISCLHHLATRTCNALLLHTNMKKREMTSSIPSLVRIWKTRQSGPGCSFIWILRVVYAVFSSKTPVSI